MASVPEPNSPNPQPGKLEASAGEATPSWIKLLQSVAIAANTASTFEEAVRTALEEVCRRTGWPLGHVLRSMSGHTLEPTSIWYVEDPHRYSEFIKKSGTMRVKAGEGLPGSTLVDRRAIWINNVPTEPIFMRRKEAADAGLQSALAFPIVIEDETVAAMEFFSQENVDPDPAFLEVMEHIGTLLGQAGEHRLIEQALVENEERTRQIIETAGDAFVEMDTDGFVTDWNKQAEKTFGWTHDEMIGQVLCDTIIPPRYRDAHRSGLETFLETGEGPILGQRLEISAAYKGGQRSPGRTKRLGNESPRHSSVQRVHSRHLGTPRSARRSRGSKQETPALGPGIGEKKPRDQRAR